MRDQRGYRGFHGVPRAGEVDVDHLPPRVSADLPRLSAGTDTGVGDDDVHSTQLVEPSGERRLNLVVVANISLRQNSSAARLLQQSFGLLQVGDGRTRVRRGVDFAAEVEADDVGAFSGQREGVGSPLSSRETGDEGDLTIELAHGN